MGAPTFQTFLQREYQREDVRAMHHRTDAARMSGARWSGLDPEPFTPRTDAEIAARAQAEYEHINGFLRSSRGVFLGCLRELEQLGWPAEAEAARSAYGRGFADAGRPPIQAEIARALAILTPIDQPAAREAVEALRAISERKAA
jgi:hypothetical protein